MPESQEVWLQPLRQGTFADAHLVQILERLDRPLQREQLIVMEIDRHTAHFRAILHAWQHICWERSAAPVSTLWTAHVFAAMRRHGHQDRGRQIVHLPFLDDLAEDAGQVVLAVRTGSRSMRDHHIRGRRAFQGVPAMARLSTSLLGPSGALRARPPPQAITGRGLTAVVAVFLPLAFEDGQAGLQSLNLLALSGVGLAQFRNRLVPFSQLLLEVVRARFICHMVMVPCLSRPPE